jgi:NAD(P)-dependent dehydrogenase (short-subunit alcohol dehydrogenase family)
MRASAESELNDTEGASRRFDLTGRVALVTGGTRGLGRVMVDAFAEAGAEIVVTSRKLDACQAVADDLRAQGRSAHAHACHMADWAAVDDLVEAVYADLGRVDVLVNNAGISPVYPSLPEVTEELWDKTLAVNLKGPFRLSALVGARMAAGGGGSIIVVSSTGAKRATGSIVPYAAAKAGVVAMVVGLADAFGPKVRVNCLMPGPFATDISRGWDFDAFNEQSKTFALRRIGRPEEVAGAALYLASDASSFTTGSTLVVDGGYQNSLAGSGDAG